MKRAHIWIGVGAVFLSSCAYMQSHKNIKEAGVSYEGCRLDEDTLTLTKKGGEWYVVAPAGVYSKKYPLIFDSMLLTDGNEPTFTKKASEQAGKLSLLPISTGTAATLQMNSGYYNPEDLAVEIQRQMKTRPVQEHGNASHTYRVAAQKAEVDSPVVLTYGNSGEPSIALRAISTLDFILVDVPGTLAYNVAIPVMAPFIFFADFLGSED